MNKKLVALLFVAILSYALAVRIGLEHGKDDKCDDKCRDKCDKKQDDKCDKKHDDKCDKKQDDKCDHKHADCGCDKDDSTPLTCKEWDVPNCDIDRDAIYEQLTYIKYSVTKIYSYLDETW